MMNLSVLVAQRMKPGEPFRKLKGSWVIFVTESDFLKKNEPFYSYEWFNRKWKNTLFTNTHIRFVNGQYEGNDAIGKLMHDFRCTDPDDMFYDEIKEAVIYLKRTAEGVNSMCEILRSAEIKWRRQAMAEGRAEGRAEGIAKGRAQERRKARRQLETTMRNLYADGMSIEKIARITNQPLSKVEWFFQK